MAEDVSNVVPVRVRGKATRKGLPWRRDRQGDSSAAEACPEGNYVKVVICRLHTCVDSRPRLTACPLWNTLICGKVGFGFGSFVCCISKADFATHSKLEAKDGGCKLYDVGLPALVGHYVGSRTNSKTPCALLGGSESITRRTS